MLDGAGLDGVGLDEAGLDVVGESPWRAQENPQEPNAASTTLETNLKCAWRRGEGSICQELKDQDVGRIKELDEGRQNLQGS